MGGCPYIFQCSFYNSFGNNHVTNVTFEEEIGKFGLAFGGRGNRRSGGYEEGEGAGFGLMML